jgi:hypothetical protein
VGGWVCLSPGRELVLGGIDDRTIGLVIFGRAVGRESIGRGSCRTRLLHRVLCNVAVIDWTDVCVVDATAGKYAGITRGLGNR